MLTNRIGSFSIESIDSYETKRVVKERVSREWNEFRFRKIISPISRYKIKMKIVKKKQKQKKLCVYVRIRSLKRFTLVYEVCDRPMR